jgi:CheY-like chemotaxis protein
MSSASENIIGSIVLSSQIQVVRLRGTIAATKRAGIGASSDRRAPLAELCGFLLAPMRYPGALCDADRMAVRCLIADDNRSFLDAARTLLEREGLTIAGVASTSADALREAERLRPDVVLVDVSLGEESGFELARRLVADQTLAATVILISTRSEVDLADLVAASPAAGFLSKSELSADAIRGFLEGASARRGR